MSTLFKVSVDTVTVTQNAVQSFVRKFTDTAELQISEIQFSANAAGELQLDLIKGAGATNYTVEVQGVEELGTGDTSQLLIFPLHQDARTDLQDLVLKFPGVTLNDDFLVFDVDFIKGIETDTAQVTVFFHPFVFNDIEQDINWATNLVNPVSLFELVGNANDEYEVTIEKNANTVPGEFRLANGLDYTTGIIQDGSTDYDFMRFTGVPSSTEFQDKKNNIQWWPGFNFEGLSGGTPFYITVRNLTSDYLVEERLEYTLGQPTITDAIFNVVEREMNEDEIYEF